MKEALKLALEALETAIDQLAKPYSTQAQYAITAIKAALAQPQQEPNGLAAYVIGCFGAAEAEGLQEALAETTDERLKDLVERRLMYALYEAQKPQRKEPEQEPVAWVVYSSAENDIVWADKGKLLKQNTPLYTTPPQQEPWCMKMNGCKTKCEDCPVEVVQQEPVAWRTFDGEGGYDYRSYEDNESYADEWDKRNPNHKGWVDKLYTTPQPAQQEPVAWKFMPRDATDSMLKAMDECSTEGYDERLYAGHAASVYMAAWDEAPITPQRTWEQPEERNFCPRCGKRTADLTVIHTCTPPQENT